MRTFYKTISLVFQPLLMPTYAMALLMNMDVFMPMPLIWRWIAIIGTFMFTGVFPALPIWLMMRRGDVKDLFISKREERTMPYLFSFMAYVFWALFLWRTLQFPTFIVAMGMGSAGSIFVIVFINLKWKISAHLAGMGGFCGGIFGVCYRLAMNPLWLFGIILAISALVALSRIELKAHTPGQTLAGFAVGFILVFTPCFFF
jgi:membrane-associated phospholipid phosphatase